MKGENGIIFVIMIGSFVSGHAVFRESYKGEF